MIKIYIIYIEPYYNNLNQEYYHILTIDKLPEGPLKQFVKLISKSNISTKIKNLASHNCIYAISSEILNNTLHKNEFCTIHDISSIYEFLINNNYNLNMNLNTSLMDILNNDNIKINNGKKHLFTINYQL